MEGRGVDGCVFLDLRHLGREKILERLPQIRELALDATGKDAIDTPIPILPGMHYWMGGIATDKDGATSIPGVYAAGECACVSVHGANRLGGNSLLETIVFGHRSATHAASYVKSVGEVRPVGEDAQRRAGPRRRRSSRGPAANAIRRCARRSTTAMSDHAFIFRDAETSTKAAAASCGRSAKRRSTMT